MGRMHTPLQGMLCIVILLALTLVACNKPESKKPRVDFAARAKAGPYIENTSQVGNGTLQVVVIPHPWGDILDKRCLLYVNESMKSSSIGCFGDTIPAMPDDDSQQKEPRYR